MIDLRSDTLTSPDEGMLRAMARAETGDDVFGEDPTVRALEEYAAELLGQEAALFCATGTMTNLLGVWLHTQPGTEVLCDCVAHIARAEMGAHGALHGVTMRTWRSEAGRVRASDVVDLLALDCGPFLVETACVAIEDTSNFGGGTVQDSSEIKRVIDLARTSAVATHLDGARLPNAAAATSTSLAQRAEGFDSVSVCLSKGLGAPIGSVLAASAEHIERARNQRKRLGGGWRQAGGLAAAGLYALEHNLERVAEDHLAAQALADEVRQVAPAAVHPVETNIVLLQVDQAPRLAAALQDQGVRLSVLGPSQLRAVTHLDVSIEQCREAGRRIAQALA